MLQEIIDYLSSNGRKGGRGGTDDSRKRKGFGSATVRAKAAATRAANRSRDEQETMRQAIVRATKAKKGDKYRECD